MYPLKFYLVAAAHKRTGQVLSAVVREESEHWAIALFKNYIEYNEVLLRAHIDEFEFQATETGIDTKVEYPSVGIYGFVGGKMDDQRDYAEEEANRQLMREEDEPPRVTTYFAISMPCELEADSGDFTPETTAQLERLKKVLIAVAEVFGGEARYIDHHGRVDETNTGLLKNR